MYPLTPFFSYVCTKGYLTHASHSFREGLLSTKALFRPNFLTAGPYHRQLLPQFEISSRNIAGKYTCVATCKFYQQVQTCTLQQQFCFCRACKNRRKFCSCKIKFAALKRTRARFVVAGLKRTRGRFVVAGLEISGGSFVCRCRIGKNERHVYFSLQG